MLKIFNRLSKKQAIGLFFTALVALILFLVVWQIGKQRLLGRFAAEEGRPAVYIPTLESFQTSLLTGDASFSYPLKLPKGPGGLTPGLTLTYSGGLVNGMISQKSTSSWVGAGWNLSLGKIVQGRREDKSEAFSIEVAGVSGSLSTSEVSQPNTCWKLYSNYEVLPCDQPAPAGTQVLRVSDKTEHWDRDDTVHNGQYGRFLHHTRRESFAKIERFNTCYETREGGKKNRHYAAWCHPGWWVVTAKNGTRHFFLDGLTHYWGVGRQSFFKGEWRLTAVVDRFGNRLEITNKYYNQDGSEVGADDDPRQLYPFEIKYGLNARAGDDKPEYLVRFNLADRPPGNGCFRDEATFLCQTKRLESVEIVNNAYRSDDYPQGVVLRKYEFAAEGRIWPETTNAFTLKKVIEYGLDGQDSLPPLTFEYENHPITSAIGGPTDFDCSEDINGMRSRRFLKEADNGFGGRTSFTYKKWQYPNQYKACHSDRWIVAGITRDGGLAGLAPAITTSYRYPDRLTSGDCKALGGNCSEGMSNGRLGMNSKYGGQGFLGFQKVEVTAPTGVKTVQFFEIHGEAWYVENGRQLKTETYAANNKKTGETIYEYTQTFASPVSFTSHPQWQGEWTARIFYLQKTKSANYDLTGTPKYTMAEQNYDSWGNQIQLFEYGEVNSDWSDKPGDERTTRAGYFNINNGRTFLIGLPSWRRVYEGINKKGLDDTGDDGREKSFTAFAYDRSMDDGDPWDDWKRADKISLGLKRAVLAFPTIQPEARYPDRFIASRTNYDAYGRPVETFDGNGNKTATAYDPVYSSLPVKTTNPKGWQTTMEYDPQSLLLVKTTDPNGLAAYTRYDHFGRPVKSWSWPDTETSPTAVFDYFYPGYHELNWENGPKNMTAVWKKIDNQGSYLNPPNTSGRYTLIRSFTDGLGKEIQTQSAGVKIENNQTVDIVATFKYDQKGRKIEATQPYSVPEYKEDIYHRQSPSPFTLKNLETAKKTVYQYDPLGRISAATNPLNQTTKTEYQPWKKIVTDANGNKTATVFDAYNRTVRTEEPENTITSRRYDAVGNLTQIVYPGGIKAGYAYDALGRKISLDDPDLGRREFRYDHNGNLVWQKDAKGQAVNLRYDELNRLVEKIYPSNPYGLALIDLPDNSYKDRHRIKFYYDQGEGAKGRKTGMEDFSGATTFKYDRRGRLVSLAREVFGRTEAFSYAYTAGGALKTIVYPDETIENVYDDAGRLAAVKSGETAGGAPYYLRSAGYNVLGAMSKAELGNGLIYANDYDQAGRLIKQVAENKATGARPFARDFQYDQVGNIVKIANKGEGSFWQGKELGFAYDGLNRLITADGLFSARYSFDNSFRMTEKQEGESVGFGYDDSFPRHAPKRANGENYRYDANGNLLEDEVRRYVWDFDNKPIKITQKKTGRSSYFVYDGEGNRVWKME